MQSSGMVHVIDDDEALRESLLFLLNAAKFKVRSYESAEAFLDAMGYAEPGCIITDVRMPGITGLELIRRLTTNHAAFPVIAISGHADVPLAVEAMKLGAVEFLEKPFEEGALISAVLGALNRHAQDSERDLERITIEERVASLSQRQRQVFLGLVAGHPNKSIAFDLGISPRTVEIYRANVMTKMRAKGLSDLVRMALVAGLLNEATGSSSASG
jgi:two-component system, LuxR family, response regulator FixJ